MHILLDDGKIDTDACLKLGKVSKWEMFLTFYTRTLSILEHFSLGRLTVLIWREHCKTIPHQFLWIGTVCASRTKDFVGLGRLVPAIFCEEVYSSSRPFTRIIRINECGYLFVPQLARNITISRCSQIPPENPVHLLIEREGVASLGGPRVFVAYSLAWQMAVSAATWLPYVWVRRWVPHSWSCRPDRGRWLAGRCCKDPKPRELRTIASLGQFDQEGIEFSLVKA